MKKLKKIIIVTIALVVLMFGAVVGKKFYDKYSEGTEKADLFQYFAFATQEQGAVMKDGVILDDYCRILNGICYVNIDMVQTYLHNRFYDSEVSREIRFTDATTVVVAPLDGSTWTSTTAGMTEHFEEPYVIALGIGETCFVALDFVEKFVPVTHEVYTNPDRVVIDSMGHTKEVARVKKDTVVRWYAGVKSDILTEVPKDTLVTVLNDVEVDGWCKVATYDGFVGYIRSNKLTKKETTTSDYTLAYTEPEFVSTRLDEKIRMGFHAVYNTSANNNLGSILDTAYNLNVICPTWFILSDNVGNFTSLASKEYVDKAHARGLQVWALVKDFDNPVDVDTYEILADSDHRTHLIEGLISTSLAIGVDGINIDFEGIRKQEGTHFVQFLRELSILCREHGLILSVDNYPPNQGNTYYDYKEQGIVADYVVLMGYDEHWGGSGDPGSTSSQPFLEDSLDNLLSMVDSSKVIDALPFYTRLWKTETNGTTDKAIMISAMQDAIDKYSLTVTFDEVTGQRYGESYMDGAYYQMWIEDANSIEKKLQAISKRDLAGIAAWRLTYEEKEIWDLIGTYIK